MYAPFMYVPCSSTSRKARELLESTKKSTKIIASAIRHVHPLEIDTAHCTIPSPYHMYMDSHLLLYLQVSHMCIFQFKEALILIMYHHCGKKLSI